MKIIEVKTCKSCIHENVCIKRKNFERVLDELRTFRPIKMANMDLKLQNSEDNSYIKLTISCDDWMGKPIQRDNQFA